MLEPEINTTDDTVSRQSLECAPSHSFDWHAPDYAAVWRKRLARLAKIRSDPRYLEALRIYYKDHTAQFVSDWGVTVDPRNAGTGKPVLMPFVLFPKQIEYIEWVLARWKAGDDGTLVKSRDCGASWLAMATSATLCLFWEDITIGFGSAIKTKVDNAGDPDSLFYKGRKFIQYLPREFRGGWTDRTCSADMRLVFPETGSSITGDCGDKIGRGGRKTIYFVDEFAFVEHPKLVDANLSANTNCRIEMSSVQGTANVFAERARGGIIPRFDFHYRDDPRKVNPLTGELYPWFLKKKGTTDPVVWAAEYECDFLASVEGIIIPQEWVQAAIGAAERLGIVPSGARRGSFDVADEGKDKNCYAAAHGVEVFFCESWSGKGSDIYQSVVRAFSLSDNCETEGFVYDADGMGAAVRGDASRVNTARSSMVPERRRLRIGKFRGSGAVVNPESKAPGTDRKNIDFFENFKAQSWWGLRQRFLLTFRVITGVEESYNPANIISIHKDLPERTQLCSELSQPVWMWSKSGKMMIDKAPDDVRSPNHADTIMMLYGAQRPPMRISDNLLASMDDED